MVENDESRIEQFYGTYRGFSPTDESNVGMGELEVKIDRDFIESRMATGLEIRQDKIETSKLQHMTKEGMRSFFGEREPKSAEEYGEFEEFIRETDMFIIGGIKYIFGPAEKYGEHGLIISGGMGDILGPTLLVGGPDGVQEQNYMKMIDEIISKIGGEREEFPTLANNGKALKE